MRSIGLPCYIATLTASSPEWTEAVFVRSLSLIHAEKPDTGRAAFKDEADKGAADFFGFLTVAANNALSSFDSTALAGYDD
jgi:hypothetical protein